VIYIYKNILFIIILFKSLQECYLPKQIIFDFDTKKVMCYANLNFCLVTFVVFLEIKFHLAKN